MKKSTAIFTILTAIFSLLPFCMIAQTQLWGMTQEGGQFGAGAIFKTDGSGNNQSLPYSFYQIEGANPRYLNLIQASDGKLYGMTQAGGANNMGVLFQFDPATSAYTKKIDFAGATNGSSPLGSLIQASDGKLYGMTNAGGAKGLGVLFQFDPATSAYTKKLDFAGTTNGSKPTGSLIQASDGKLYGMTQQGGSNGFGALFLYDPATSTCTKKIDFAGATNGSYGQGALMQASDGKLYGMTQGGGANDMGVLFQFDPATSAFTKKLDFAGVTNGRYPFGSLIQASDGKLYGMTYVGGANDLGVLFQFNPATSAYTKKLDFARGTNGSNPWGSLMQSSDGKLYGMTYEGGSNGLGVLFQFDPATSAFAKKIDFTGVTNGANPQGSLMQASDGNLYGMTSQSGSNGLGVLFQFDPTTSAYSKKLDFVGATNGSNPYASLMQATDGKFYGMTQQGGSNNLGVLFQFDPATSVYTKKLDFAGATNGSYPWGSLMQATDGKLYGMTLQGGANNLGVLFQFDPATSAYTKKIDFDGTTNGSKPMGSLMQASDGKLYGLTSAGGANGYGVLFQFDPATSAYTKKIDFAWATNGGYPRGSLMQASDGKLYGMTPNGGTNERGVLFQFDPATSALTKKFDFSVETNGILPLGSLIQASDGKLYGMTFGGANYMGSLFQFDPVTAAYTKKLDFAGATNGSYPYGSLMLASNGKLYGMTQQGGANNLGVLFQFDPATSAYTKKLDFNGTNGKSPFNSNLIEITQYSAPSITSFSPSSGSVGTLITINGTNLTGASAVSIGGTATTSVTVVNATTVTALVASGTTGTVSVTTPGGTASSAGTFTFRNPAANAGADQSVNEGVTVTLDGSASTDPNGNTLTYLWTPPAGITLSSTTAAKPTFTAPQVNSNTDYTFSLVVNDGSVDSPADQVVIQIKNLTVNQDITMNTGWNIISTYTIPSNLDLVAIFQPLITAGKLKKVMDEAGKTMENFGAFGGWKNNIGNLRSSKGYKVNVAANSILSLEGLPVQLPFDISLAAGWNIISYPSATAQDAKALVQPLIDNSKLIKIMDEAGKTIENFGALGGWKNNIGNFLPGKGYKVNVATACTLTITGSANKAAIIVPDVLASAHFAKVYSGNGTDHFNVHMVDLASSGLVAGDQIGIFDGNYCAGAATIGHDQLMSGNISIPSSFNDELTGKVNGFTVGHAVTLQLYRDNMAYPLTPSIVSGSQAFEKNGSLFVKVVASDLPVAKISVEADQVKCYPNPFVDQLTIEIRLTQPKNLEVKIYDLSGKLVRSLYKGEAGTSETLIWDGTNGQGTRMISGTYILKANEMIEKVALKK